MATKAVAPQDHSGEKAFLSAEFLQKLPVVQGRQKELKDALEDIQRKIELTNTKENRVRLELDGGDLLAEIRRLEAEKRRIESAIPGAKADVQELFAIEFKLYGELRNVLWSRCLHTIVEPHLEKLNRLLESLREVVRAFGTDAHGSALADVDALESQLKAYNELVKQNGVGLNLLIPMSSGDSLRSNVSLALKENLKKSFNEPACAELREILSGTTGKT